MVPVELMTGEFEWGPISPSRGVGQSQTADRPQDPCFPTISYRSRSMDLDDSPPPFGGKHGSEKTRLKRKVGKPGPMLARRVEASGPFPCCPSLKVVPRQLLIPFAGLAFEP